MLCAEASYSDILVSGTQQDNLRTIFDAIARDEKEIMELPKGLRLVILRFLTNVAGSKEGAQWLEANHERITRRVIDNLRFLQSEPAALTAILMLIMNLLQNIGGGKTIEQDSSAILERLLDVFNRENDEKNLLACVVNLCWLSYKIKTVRVKIQQAGDFAKIEKLRLTALDGNLAKTCKDLQKIVAKA